MKIIKIKKSELKKGRDVTPDCDGAKILHISKDKFAISIRKDIPAIGFRSKTFSKFAKKPPSPIIDIKATEHWCLCCLSITEEIVLTILTEDGLVYQIDSSDRLTAMISIKLNDS